MYRIILDCDLMRYKDSGLYHYCLNLGTHVKNALNKEQGDCISFYVPSSERRPLVLMQEASLSENGIRNFLNPFCGIVTSGMRLFNREGSLCQKRMHG